MTSVLLINNPLKILPTFNTPAKAITLEDVYETFRKWYHIEDTNLIDFILAVKINMKLDGIPLWGFLVGKSGVGKSTVYLEAIYSPLDTEVIYSLTSRTLVSGKKEVKVDLVQKFWGKLVIIYDLAKVITSNPLEKAGIFAQFRDWYDGHLGGSYGTGKDVKYEGKPPQLLVGVTNAIYNEKIIHDKLGTRELLYKIEIQDVEALKKKAMWLTKNLLKETAKKDCQKIVREFISNLQYAKIEIPEEVDNKILEITEKLSIMRATAEVDLYTGELKADAEFEVASRSSQQFLQLYRALKILDPEYPDEKAFEMFEHIVNSSGDQITMKVYEYLKKEILPLTTNEVAKQLKLGWKTVYSRLNLLWNMNIIDREITSNPEGGGTAKTWTLASN